MLIFWMRGLIVWVCHYSFLLFLDMFLSEFLCSTYYTSLLAMVLLKGCGRVEGCFTWTCVWFRHVEVPEHDGIEAVPAPCIDLHRIPSSPRRLGVHWNIGQGQPLFSLLSASSFIVACFLKEKLTHGPGHSPVLQQLERLVVTGTWTIKAMDPTQKITTLSLLCNLCS